VARCKNHMVKPVGNLQPEGLMQSSQCQRDTALLDLLASISRSNGGIMKSYLLGGTAGLCLMVGAHAQPANEDSGETPMTAALKSAIANPNKKPVQDYAANRPGGAN